MKLAEALILRSDCQKRLEQLKQRLVRAAKVQEGDQPPEEPAELLAEAERTSADLLRLIRLINRTNCEASFGEGRLSDALAARDIFKLRRAVYADIASAAIVQQNVYSKSEVRFRSTVRVADMQRQADDLSKEYRELDARIQEANWRIDLIES